MADIGWATTAHEYYGARAHWQDDPLALGSGIEPPGRGGQKR